MGCMMVHLPMISEKTETELVKALKRPEGTFMFAASYNGIFDKSKGKVYLMEVVSGQTVFRLEREGNLDVNFVFSSPGTGARISTVNIEPLKGSSYLQFFLTWSPVTIGLSIGGDDRRTLLTNEGCRNADYQLLVGSDGNITQVGSKGMQIMNLLVIQNGKAIVENPAIKNWQDTLDAVKILQTGTSTEGHIFENIVSCVSLGVLCTGFETYCRRRFLEIVGECIEPNYSELEKKFFSQGERENGLINQFAQQAKQKGHSLAHELVERRRIDFGNYNNCKDAYSKGYGISFTEDLGVPIQTIQKIVAFIQYRHRIVHVSPLQGVLNYYELPAKEPVFANKATTDIAIKSFGTFIEALHIATLKLRPSK